MQRSITYCTPELQAVYYVSVEEYKLKYPQNDIILTCTYRSPEEQDRLYEIGRSTEGKIVTNAKGKQSPHNFYPSLAFDFAVQVNKKVSWNVPLYIAFWKICQANSKNIVYGGNFNSIKDFAHIEMRDWKKLT